MSAPRSMPTCVAADELPPIPRASGFSVRAQIVAGTCACAAGSLFLFAVNPSQHAVYPQCMLYNATGYYCAGCGATRALYALLHGRVILALHDNALFMSALPIILYVIATSTLSAWRANAWPQVYLQPGRVVWGSTAIFSLMMAFMIVRNLPGPAFELLRPLP